MWEKVAGRKNAAKHLPGKVLVSKIYKQILKVIRKKLNNSI